MKKLVNLRHAAGPRPFSHVKFYDLMNSYVLFRIVHSDFLFRHSEEILRNVRRIFGDRMFFWGLKQTIGRQFTCGETVGEASSVVRSLTHSGFKVAVNYMAEFDRGESRESAFDDNLKKYLESVRINKFAGRPFFVGIKVSALVDFALLEEASRRQEEADKFFLDVKGASQFERPISELAKALEARQLASRAEIDDFLAKIKLFSKGDSLHFGEWRLGMSFFHNFRPELNGHPVHRNFYRWSEHDSTRLEALFRRMREVCQVISDSDSLMLGDAEQSYFFAAITNIIEQMQMIYNKKTPVVYNTVQAYLIRSKPYIDYEISKARLIGASYPLALKLVRGAYIVEENELEKKHGIDIVHDSKTETDENYNLCAELMANSLRENDRFIIASHNEPSVLKMIAKAQEDPALKEKIIFATLLGLSDYMTIAVKNLGFTAMKYIPYGESYITLPYLLRRSVEARKMALEDHELIPKLKEEMQIRLKLRRDLSEKSK